MLKKKLLILGCGASGLVTLKEFTSSEAFHVVCMEQLSVVGGLWNYSEVVKHADHPTGLNHVTSVYKNLRTNIPRQIMNFSDLPFSSNLPSFIHHSDVKEYLWNYSKINHLEKYVKFNTRVTSVKPKTLIGREDVWEVESLNIQDKKTETNEFDIVIVCNGHFSKAIYPKNIKGINDFEGTIIHSQQYRDPEDYRGKRVMVVGAGPSGVDIISDLCLTAQKIWLSQRFSVKVSIPDEIEQVGEIIELIGKDVIIDPYAKGSSKNYWVKLDPSAEMKISTCSRACNVDVLIFCTGFSYSFPFLAADCGVGLVTPEVVAPLYKDLICLGRQSLSFIGLQHKTAPFILFEQEAKFLRFFYEGKVKLPSYGDELLQLVRKDEDIRRKHFHDFDLHKHTLGEFQWAYINDLAEMAGFEKPPAHIENLHKQVNASRKVSLFKYKDIEYEMGPEGFYVISLKKFERNEV